MPTGFTQLLHDNPDTTTAEFIMRCARAMGACVSMRDEPLSTPIPETLKVDQYYVNRVAETQRRLLELNAMTPEQARNQAHLKQCEANLTRAEELEKYKKIATVIENMTKSVTKWRVPTEQHEGLKSFMLEQLGMENPQWMVDYYSKPVESLEGDEWLKGEIERAKVDVERAEQRLKEEIESTTTRNEWIKQLRESLPK